MSRRLTLRALNRGYHASLRREAARFHRACLDPRAVQRARLRAVLEAGRDTAFGRQHRLDRVHSLTEFQAAVPVRSYDRLASWIERVVEGEPHVLTRARLVAFETSSGSTHAKKWLPYTRELLGEFAAATTPWLHDLYGQRPALLDRSAYWSITPAGPPRPPTAAGIPVGLANDTDYFPKPVRWVLRQLLPVPNDVARLPTLDACRHATLLYLLADPRLGLASVWSPSAWTLLIAYALEHTDALARDLERGSALPVETPRSPARAAQVRAAPRDPAGFVGALWPQLAVLSCWADGPAARPLAQVRAELPAAVEVQPKGLLATEGVVSFPLWGAPAPVLAIRGHVLEFAPEDDLEGVALGAHELDLGGRYAPVLTTSGGLWRYRLGDVVEVVGRYRETPCVRFVGRLDGVCDLAGEKLHPGFVEGVFQRLAPDARFALLTPEGPRYVAYLEGSSLDPEALDRGLRANPHYDLCRRMGQLQAPEVRAVREGAARYEQALVARGVRAGDLKPTGLHGGTFWGEEFGDQTPSDPRDQTSSR